MISCNCTLGLLQSASYQLVPSRQSPNERHCECCVNDDKQFASGYRRRWPSVSAAAREDLMSVYMMLMQAPVDGTLTVPAPVIARHDVCAVNKAVETRCTCFEGLSLACIAAKVTVLELHKKRPPNPEKPPQPDRIAASSTYFWSDKCDRPIRISSASEHLFVTVSIYARSR